MKPAPLSTTLTSSLRPRHGGTTNLDFTTGQEIRGKDGSSFWGPQGEGATFSVGMAQEGWAGRQAQDKEAGEGGLGKGPLGMGIRGYLGGG